MTDGAPPSLLSSQSVGYDRRVTVRLKTVLGSTTRPTNLPRRDVRPTDRRPRLLTGFAGRAAAAVSRHSAGAPDSGVTEEDRGGSSLDWGQLSLGAGWARDAKQPHP